MVAIQSLIFTSIALLSSVSAYGQIAQVIDANNFCVFLPPTDSVDRSISDTEWNAQAFCLGKTPLATNAGKLNSGFIQSAHYLATDKYVQVTGKIDPSKAKLSATDEGGQYDIKAPKGSSCAGWKFYVNLIEPTGNTYCMRCCNDDRSCNRGISEKGCAHIIPGDYSGPDVKSEKTTTKSTTTTTIKKTTTTTTTVKKTTTTTVADKAANTLTTEKESINVAAPTTKTEKESTITATTTTVEKENTIAATPILTTATTTTQVEATIVLPTTTITTTTISEPTVTPVAAAVTPAAAASPASDASSDNKVDMLSQNDSASAQSVSGSTQFQPSIIAFGLVAIAVMLQY